MKMTIEDGIHIVDFGEDENRTTYSFIDELFELLDEVEAASGPKALVTTGSGKIYSNGLDVDYMQANPGDVSAYVGRTMAMCARILTFPAPTAAAMNGHAFGLGAFVALSHDHRIMREDRGYVCWPEIALDMAFPHPLQELNRARLDPWVMHEAMVTGRRYGGADAASARIVHSAVPAEEVLSRAFDTVTPLMGQAGPVLGKIKRDLYGPLVGLLTETET